MTLTHRMLINGIRNVGVYHLRIMMYCVMSLCLGTIFLRLGYTV